MKEFIAEQRNKKLPWQNFKSNNAKFKNKPYTKKLMRMNYKTEGKMKTSGVLEAAQNNQRLHKTDGYFYLQAKTILYANKKTFRTGWQIDSYYDFEPFDKKNYYTVIPLGKFKMILPDGLSQYMTKIGAAKEFWYRAIWYEEWTESSI